MTTLLLSTMKKGINVQKQLAVFQIAHAQYKEVSRANFYAKFKKQELPYTEEYKQTALTAYVKAEIELDAFVDCVNSLDELHVKLEDNRRFSATFPESKYHAEEYATMKAFIESIEQQTHLLPIVEAELKANAEK